MSIVTRPDREVSIIKYRKDRAGMSAFLNTERLSQAEPVTGGSVKTGYLHESFRLFHLKDQVKREFESHYHDFYKIVFFVSGKAGYHIEGRTYTLLPGDILLVDRFAIHKPEIDASVPYERYVLWIRADLAEQRLLECFKTMQNRATALLRVSPDKQHALRSLLSELEKEDIALKQNAAGLSGAGSYGADLLMQSIFVRLMISLERIILGETSFPEWKNVRSDTQVDQLLHYINTHLTDDLSADSLAKKYYINKYYLMRRFKEATGYTLHQYVLSKRLIQGRTLISGGVPVTKAAVMCGFGDYTTFIRAYKKQFHSVPGEARQNFFPAETQDI